MPHITGSVGAAFFATLDSGTILEAKLHIPGSGNPDTILVFTAQTVTILDLPAGPSIIRIAIDFDPGDPDATIGVSNVTAGHAAAANPPGTISNDGVHAAGTITMGGA